MSNEQSNSPSTDSTSKETSATETKTEVNAGNTGTPSDLSAVADKSDEASTLAAAAAKKKYKVKVENEELEVDEDELLRGYQLSKASYKKMSEAAKQRKQAQEVLELIKKDPMAALTHPAINVNLREFAEKVIQQQLEEELSTPEQKEIRRLKREMAEKDEKLAKEEKAREEKRAAEMQTKYQEEYTKLLEEVFKLNGLPRNKRSINRTLDYIEEALENEIEIDPKEVARMVRSDYEGDIKALFGNVEPETLLSLLGEDSVKKLRQADIAKFKTTTPEKMPEKQPDAKPRTDEPKKRLTANEVFGKR